MSEVPGKKSKFLDEYKKKHETKVTDAEALKAKNHTMEGILKDIVSAPERMVMTGPVGNTSVRPTKKNENDLHGKDGKFKVTEM